ncbi:TraR/DksA C4-type zinc finger protein [Solimonas sp. K1W22B-7]|uniref:TraR/DksA C4-type zinc finger protein n=1 Tax=Solimonas sp. K1W22B-7 TaxID=2303331 RepID=UPI0019697DD9|nr:TraR/DksA C4-type zinc finger protein [Solimonas sp. K1W22B-7]
MPDFMDLIQEAEARVSEALNASARLSDSSAFGRSDCADCGDEIDPRRLAVVRGASRCTLCEQLAQRHDMHFRSRSRPW